MADDRLIFLLSRAHHKLQGHLRGRLAAAGVRLSMGQAGILFLLKQKDGRTMTELSEALSTDNSAVTGLIDRLEKLGFIHRTPCSNDRRAFRIHITSEGLEEIAKAKAIIRAVNEEIKEGSDSETIEAFRTVLQRIFEKFSRGREGQSHREDSGKPAKEREE